MQDSYEINKNKFKIELAKIIKKYRLQSGKSIYLLSNEIGMTRTMWNDLERAIKDPQITTLWRISEGLGIPISVLFDELEKNLGKNFSLIE